VIAVLTLKGGCTVAYEGDWAAHDGATSWNGEWELVGERGRILWNGGEQDATQSEVRLQHWGEESELVEPPPDAEDDQAGTLREFVDAVAVGRTPETSAADNFRSLAVVLACVASIERGEAVAVVGV
jgi:predicted dehydrogenase